MLTFLIVLVVILAVVCVVQALLLFSPLSVLRENGHTCLAVKNEEAARVLCQLFATHGVHEQFTFDAGTTHQTLMTDNNTVLIWHDPHKGTGSPLPPNGRSLISANPNCSAENAVTFLRIHGFTARIADRITNPNGDIVIVETDAFDNAVLVFRRHVMKLGKPPNKRRISDL